MTTATKEPRVQRSPAVTSRFRPDIQGLRAIAVGIVLVFHADATLLPGGFVGVDVFFVISGFLITGMLLRQGVANGRIDLADFYARRVRRILPAATLVLLVTAAATVILLPRTRWASIGSEVAGSAFYYVNWLFAANTDYLNADAPPSPLQHFWTLAVEEQFYIVWPLLLVALLYGARLSSRSRVKWRLGTDPARTRRRLIEAGVVVITLPSFAWSIFYTGANAAPAYFVTTTRLWELGIGAAVAVFAIYLERIPRTLGYVVGAVGLGAISAAALLYSNATPFPGYAALLPTLGAAAIIVGGMGGRAERGVGAALSARPMRWIGDLSYSLYLWHWPMVVIGTFLLGGALETWQGLLIVGASILPAWVSYRFVEGPLRDSKQLAESVWLTLQTGLILMMVSMLAGMWILLTPPVVNAPPPRSLAGGPIGSAPIAPDEGAALLALDPSVGMAVDESEFFRPSVDQAIDDIPPMFGRGCHREANETEFTACVFGDEGGEQTVAVIGDSHAGQWVPALLPIANERGWRMEVYTKSACPFNARPILDNQGQLYGECTEWNEAALAGLTGSGAPDHLIVSASVYVGADETSASVVDGYAEAWSAVMATGASVTVILGTPQPRIDVPECVAVNPTTMTACAVPRERAMMNSSFDPLRRAAERVGADTVDLTSMICPQELCAPVIGSVLVYRDTNHLTATYASSLAKPLAEILESNGTLPRGE